MSPQPTRKVPRHAPWASAARVGSPGVRNGGAGPWIVNLDGIHLEEVEKRARFKPPRTLADMSEEEIKALEAKYGCAIKRPEREGK